MVGRNLTFLYRKVLNYLQESSKQAAELFSIMVFTGRNSTSATFMEQALVRALRLSPVHCLNMAHIIYVRACAVLERLHLVQIGSDGMEINLLTQSICRDILSDSAPRYTRLLIELVDDLIIALRDEFSEVKADRALEEADSNFIIGLIQNCNVRLELLGIKSDVLHIQRLYQPARKLLSPKNEREELLAERAQLRELLDRCHIMLEIAHDMTRASESLAGIEQPSQNVRQMSGSENVD